MFPSRQVNREAVKRPRDLAQARAVAALVRTHLPHLPFEEALTCLHSDVRSMGKYLQE
jgi:uncharacterized protein (DUF2267 family)